MGALAFGLFNLNIVDRVAKTILRNNYRMRHGVVGPEPHVDDVPRRHDVWRGYVAAVATDVTGLGISTVVNLLRRYPYNLTRFFKSPFNPKYLWNFNNLLNPFLNEKDFAIQK